MSEQARVFVGVPVEGNLLANIQSWRANFSDPDIRWVDDSNLHMTLLPPQENVDVAAAKESLRSIQGLGCIALLDRIELGSNPKQPNLVWVRGENTSELMELKRNVETAFNQPVSDTFLPHVTLAKFDRNNIQEPIRGLHEAVNWQHNLDKVVLYRVDRKGQGTTYTQLATKTLS